MVAQRRLRVVDVALWYGERSGGIRTYVDAKVADARATAACEHHVVLPGPRERHRVGRHELPGLRARSRTPGTRPCLGWRYGWDRLFADELAHLTELVA